MSDRTDLIAIIESQKLTIENLQAELNHLRSCLDDATQQPLK